MASLDSVHRGKRPQRLVEGKDLRAGEPHRERADEGEGADGSPGAPTHRDRDRIERQREGRVRDGVDGVAVDHRREADGREDGVASPGARRDARLDRAIEQVEDPRKQPVKEMPRVPGRDLERPPAVDGAGDRAESTHRT